MTNKTLPRYDKQRATMLQSLHARRPSQHSQSPARHHRRRSRSRPALLAGDHPAHDCRRRTHCLAPPRQERPPHPHRRSQPRGPSVYPHHHRPRVRRPHPASPHPRRALLRPAPSITGAQKKPRGTGAGKHSGHHCITAVTEPAFTARRMKEGNLLASLTDRRFLLPSWNAVR